MSDTRQQILADIKSAMKSGDKARLSTLRLISAAMKQKEVDERAELTEQDTLDILGKMVKQRRESIDQYTKAGRDDLREAEEAEIEILQTYMPEPLGSDEVDALIKEAIESVNASSVKDMGKVMAALKPKLQGRADMGQVGGTVKSLLNG